VHKEAISIMQVSESQTRISAVPVRFGGAFLSKKKKKTFAVLTLDLNT